MAFDELLAERVRELLSARNGLVERKTFGGIAFMLRCPPSSARAPQLAGIASAAGG